MRIEILQAGTGDSIWISYNKKNVVIDGGKLTSAIRARYDQMPQDEPSPSWIPSAGKPPVVSAPLLPV